MNFQYFVLCVQIVVRNSNYLHKQAIQTFVVAAGSTDNLGEDHVFEQLTETMVELPNGKFMSVVELVDALHLDAFVDSLLNV